ncbi:hypothetical protein FTO74_14305 [Granulicella sp. WH15]|uniref:hypothetical protein n=1 Tax=Granulicella sp. WH15 TaxID=2602070 RepID=UPI0013668B97|nr:hypothetical protein [Granulicella sp. WH15]QHN04404.1 hypothetical protein FTO74_14305 [Granulicella sp. WH15]
MKKTSIAILLLLATLHCMAQNPPSLRQVFKDKTLEAIQDTDGIDVLSSEMAYSLNFLNARKSVMAAARSAVGQNELKVANFLWRYLEWTKTCRITQAAGSSSDAFKSCLANKDAMRSSALEAAGIDEVKVYPRL